MITGVIDSARKLPMRVRNRILATAKASGKPILTKLGLFRPIPPYFQETSVACYKSFMGDRPRYDRFAAKMSTDNNGNNVFPIVNYTHRRPRYTDMLNVYYTPIGNLWNQGALDESGTFSPAVWPYVQFPYLFTTNALDSGTIIQTDHTYTYGDWLSEFIKTIACAREDMTSPLIIPKHLSKRGYVFNDLNRIGIDCVVAEDALMIRNARVLHKRDVSHYWSQADMLSVRNMLDIQVTAPRKGSIIYLSREGVRSTNPSATRGFPHEVIYPVMRARGIKIVRTCDLMWEDFKALNDSCNIVIADHGAALFNIIQWEVTGIIELVTDSWWDSCFLSLSSAAGVLHNGIINIDDGEAHFVRSLDKLLDAMLHH